MAGGVKYSSKEVLSRKNMFQPQTLPVIRYPAASGNARITLHFHHNYELHARYRRHRIAATRKQFDERGCSSPRSLHGFVTFTAPLGLSFKPFCFSSPALCSHCHWNFRAHARSAPRCRDLCPRWAPLRVPYRTWPASPWPCCSSSFPLTYPCLSLPVCRLRRRN